MTVSSRGENFGAGTCDIGPFHLFGSEGGDFWLEGGDFGACMHSFEAVGSLEISIAQDSVTC